MGIKIKWWWAPSTKLQNTQVRLFTVKWGFQKVWQTVWEEYKNGKYVRGEKNKTLWDKDSRETDDLEAYKILYTSASQDEKG